MPANSKSFAAHYRDLIRDRETHTLEASLQTARQALADEWGQPSTRPPLAPEVLAARLAIAIALIRLELGRRQLPR